MYSILSNIPFGSHLVLQDGKQTISSPTWVNVFTFLQSRHFHAEDGRTTPHTESLWDHLVQCGELSYAKAKSMGLTEHECRKAYFAGFLHDIGKPGTLTCSSKYIAFKGHGIVGGAILENAWTPELGEALQFSEADWADLSMLADVHMCGYFPHQTEHSHAVGFQILPTSVKRLLPCLRWGDMASMVSKDPSQFPSDPAPDEERFMRTLFAPLDTKRLVKERPCGILIQLCGSSGTGKTTLANWLKTQLSARGCEVHVITRDTYMVRESMRQMNVPWDGVIMPEIYRTAYAQYLGTGKSYSSVINGAMKHDIQSALQKGHIVILDTLMCMYPHALKSILPDCVEKSFRVRLWVHRNTVFTEEEAINRLGMSLDEQLKVHGDTGIAWNPFRSDLLWKMLVSDTEH
jgi:hypothetical protein